MLKIRTKKNEYLYDNSSGYILPLNQQLEQDIERVRMKENNEKIKTPVFNKYRKLNIFEEYYKNGLRAEIKLDETHLRHEITNSLFMNMQLVLTGKCNFRCEYCMYSDKYPEHVDFENCSMTYDVAQKGIDLFAELVEKKMMAGEVNCPSITFYGGEPLLEFSAVERIVEYSKRKIPEIRFGITTNASLLDDKKIKFMIENDFSIAISLDGYKLNHDRNRKFADGAGTYNIVWEKIQRIRQLDKDHNAEIIILCCVDRYTDLLVLADYFNSIYSYIEPCTLRINPINQLDTTYYEFCDDMYKNSTQYEKQNQEASMRILRERLQNDYYGNRTAAILSPFFAGEINVLFGNKGVPRFLLNNSCIPGSKLTVLPTGQIAPCEKTGNNFIIGNVFDGLDFGRIESMTKKFIKVLRECEQKKCPIRRICGACYAYLRDSGELQEGFCDLEVRSKSRMLKTICETLEEDPPFYKKLKVHEKKL